MNNFSLKSPRTDSMGILVPLLMSCFKTCLEHGVFPRLIGTRGPHDQLLTTNLVTLLRYHRLHVEMGKGKLMLH